MPKEILVTKRDGSQEPLDLNKLHKVVTWACEGLTGVSPSEVELHAQLSLVNNIKSSDIQETLIKSAAGLISEDAPNYQYVAGRLVNYHLRKGAYGQFDPPSLKEHVENLVAQKFYTELLLEVYDDEDWTALEKIVDHDRDMLIAYAGMEQFRGKYLTQNRSTDEILETPQFCNILVAAMFFHRYPKETRLAYVEDFYDAIAPTKGRPATISVPTPVMAGLRSRSFQFSSCVLIESGDSIPSIFSTAYAVGTYVSQKAGIGINGGRIRGVGSPIRNGEAYSTGVVPYYRVFQDAVKSCSQGGVRGGAATLYYQWWHQEVEDLIVLKNTDGTDENRLRKMDYGLQMNGFFYQRYLNGEDVHLFSPSDVPGLFEAFYEDQDKFKEMYEKAERSRIRKKRVPASQIMELFVQNRKGTGRIYPQNVDHCNTHGSFLPDVAPVRMSNLCAEVTLPTNPFESIDDPNGEIALCILLAINWGAIKTPADFQKPADLCVRALDELIDFQTYPFEMAAKSARNRRSLGIGIINFAYWLAKNDLTYQDIDQTGLTLIDEWAEAWSYHLIKASADLAVEKGACAWNDQTKYSKGILPVDTYKRDVDDLVPYTSRMPWAELKMQLLATGIRNSTLMACMPAETSAQISNSTNGVEPVLELVTSKSSKHGRLPQVAPELNRLKNKYDLRNDQKSPLGYLKIMAVLQKHTDQSISVNTSYNPRFYPGEKIPMSEIITHILLWYKWGGKTMYYFNTSDGAGEVDVVASYHSEPESPPGDYTFDDDCDSCKI